jgi:hypothetical protein
MVDKLVTVTAPCLLAATNKFLVRFFFSLFSISACQNRDRCVTARLKEVNDRLIDCGFGRVEWNVPSRAETGLTYGACQQACCFEGAIFRVLRKNDMIAKRKNSALLVEELNVAGHSVILRLLFLDFGQFRFRPCGLHVRGLLVLEVRVLEWSLSVSMELSGY